MCLSRQQVVTSQQLFHFPNLSIPKQIISLTVGQASTFQCFQL